MNSTKPKKYKYILSLQEVQKSDFSLVGGKGAGLAELATIEGIQVPVGFCITTKAYKAHLESNQVLAALLDQMCVLTADESKKITQISAQIRQVIEEIPIEQELEHEILQQIKIHGEENAYAVRSSATAEDLPSASFAGQQDTFLNCIDIPSILTAVRKCWASLFTTRAVIYRIQNGFDHRKVYLAVIVQKMIFPDVAGILFTADPITANRKFACIEASFGLGEAVVSGLVNTDHYKVVDRNIVDKRIALKQMAIYAVKEGGTKKEEITSEKQQAQALTDAQILQLERMGRKIEAHFGIPQDIEWGLTGNIYHLLQSRPITTLYPIPQADDEENHVYLSVGHQQMMTDAMKPLGLSFWLWMTPPKTRAAGGRLFVDATPMLSSTSSRNTILNTLGKFDPLFKDALSTIITRENFIKSSSVEEKEQVPNKTVALPDYEALYAYDPTIVAALINKSQKALAVLKHSIEKKSGLDLFDFILADILQLKSNTTNPQSLGVIMTGMNASSWINEKMNEWLGEKNAADLISQSAPNNITSEMGLELLDVADAIRPYPDVIAYLKQVKEDNFLAGLVSLDGGKETYAALKTYLSKYGMRCVGEIDITKSRWIEKPILLVPLLLSNLKNFKSGESRRRFERGLQEALKKEQDLLARLKQLPDGEQKVKATKQMIELVRNYAGYREYPKYAIISQYLVYKQALLAEAEKLLKMNVIREIADVFYLYFEEFRKVVETKKIDYELIAIRKEAYKIHQKLSPPRVMTSDGEIFNGEYKRENIPNGAIAGLGVSSGVIEGRARVILNMEDADLEQGDILITAFTDPSCTPFFVSIKGLVTEVGGLMTHGAVIAREYGLPAVVGVANATRIIKDGQRIRVNGTAGFIEILL